MLLCLYGLERLHRATEQDLSGSCNPPCRTAEGLARPPNRLTVSFPFSNILQILDFILCEFHGALPSLDLISQVMFFFVLIFSPFSFIWFAFVRLSFLGEHHAFLVNVTPSTVKAFDTLHLQAVNVCPLFFCLREKLLSLIIFVCVCVCVYLVICMDVCVCVCGRADVLCLCFCLLSRVLPYSVLSLLWTCVSL